MIAAERVAIEGALKRAGTVARAAEILGLDRSHFHKKLRKQRLPYQWVPGVWVASGRVLT